jgi:hypothetical protein
MKKLTNKQRFWISIIALVVGLAFLIWGGIIYRHFPGIHEARIIMRHATWHAGIQYLLGFISLIIGYIYVQKS